MRYLRAFAGVVGASGSLIAAGGIVLAILSTGLAFHGWPDMRDPSARATQGALDGLPAAITLGFLPYAGDASHWVALARALAVEPKVLLMDEPLSNLDARLREEVRDEIRSLAKKLSITVFYVTHDQVEAMALADRIAVMSAGKILQIGAPKDLYHFPLNRKVGEFLGSMNEFDGTLQSNGCVQTDLGVVSCTVPNGTAKEVIVAIRPEDVSLSREPSGLSNEFPAQLVSQLFLGDMTLCYLSANGQKLRGKTAGLDQQFEPGSSIYVRFPTEKLKIFSR